jgi:hypothetical protein
MPLRHTRLKSMRGKEGTELRSSSVMFEVSVSNSFAVKKNIMEFYVRTSYTNSRVMRNKIRIDNISFFFTFYVEEHE